MANPIPPTPSDQPNTSISAAELRRRLLASAPPPLAAANGETPEEFAAQMEPAPPAVSPQPTPTPAVAPPPSRSSSTDLLARLRMPGKSGAVPVPPPPRSVVAPLPTAPETLSVRPPLNRRTPLTPGRHYEATIAGALNHLHDLTLAANRHEDSPLAEIQRLRAENSELRSLLEEMKHLLQEASNTEQELVAKHKQYEDALQAKDAQIEELSAQLGAIEEQIAKGELVPPPPAPKTRTELEEWADELEKESAKLAQERKRLEDERRQLREDEEALENQMRTMEVSMARERALLARQETELRRLSAEIQHELELLQRGDSGLREQLAKFQRRAHEVMSNPGSPNGRR